MNPAVVGSALAIAGSLVSLYGACVNNLYHEHRKAMKIWAVSNLLLLLWAIGYTAGWWDGAIAGVALIVLYLVYSITNFWGLWKNAGRS